MNTELLEALELLEKEKDISKESLLDAIENSLLNACKSHFGKADNIKVIMDRESCDYQLYAEKEVVEDVEDTLEQISLEDARKMDGKYDIGDIVHVPIESKSFGRIATQNAKNVILQKIREEEKNAIYNEYHSKEHEIITGIVQRIDDKGNILVDIGRTQTTLKKNECVKGENYQRGDRIKLYVLEVSNGNKNNNNDPKADKEKSGPLVIRVSRKTPYLVKRLFEEEVAEIKDGVVKIVSIAREEGSRTKISVKAEVPNVDPVGACVGINGARVKAIVNELGNEQIDIIEWDENPAQYIVNALSPAKVVSISACDDENGKKATVVVSDQQLSLAIGKAGQNVRLAAKLTGYGIDIKSESQIEDSAKPESDDETDIDDDMLVFSEDTDTQAETDADEVNE